MSDTTRKTRHISFDVEENELLEARAEAAGMGVCAYIKKQALEGTVRSVNLDLLMTHAALVNDIAEAIEYNISRKHNRWMYSTDIDFLKEQLQLLVDTESDLIQKVLKSD